MKTGKNILVLLPMSEAQKQALEAQAPGCSFSYAKQKTLTSEQLLGAHVIIGNVPATAIAASQKLEWLQLSSAGAGAYLKPGHFPAQALLTNATGAYGLAISEYMIGVLLQLQKKLHLYRDNQHKHLWQSEGTVTSIEGSKTLVIGLGDIGGDFARKMKALGSYTIVVKRHVSVKPSLVVNPECGHHPTYFRRSPFAGNTRKDHPDRYRQPGPVYKRGKTGQYCRFFNRLPGAAVTTDTKYKTGNK